jgi:alpha-glucosidase (family GH31 glycosyl hydrolase)
LFFDYPTDAEAFNNNDNTFMLGDALKISPVLTQGVTGQFQSYFPEGSWYDLNSNDANFYFNSTGQ